MRISDWSSDVCSSDLLGSLHGLHRDRQAVVESGGDIEDGETGQNRQRRQAGHRDSAQPQRQQRAEIAPRAAQLPPIYGEFLAPPPPPRAPPPVPAPPPICFQRHSHTTQARRVGAESVRYVTYRGVPIP